MLDWRIIELTYEIVSVAAPLAHASIDGRTEMTRIDVTACRGVDSMKTNMATGEN